MADKMTVEDIAWHELRKHPEHAGMRVDVTTSHDYAVVTDSRSQQFALRDNGDGTYDYGKATWIELGVALDGHGNMLQAYDALRWWVNDHALKVAPRWGAR